MQGRTQQQLRSDILTRLAAAAAVTAVVPTQHQYQGRTLPLPDDFAGSALVVYVDSETMNFAGSGYLGPMDLPTMSVASVVVIEYYASAASDTLIEQSLDFAETILETLLADITYTRLYDRIDTIQIGRATSDKGRRRLGATRIALTVAHRRAWG